MKHITSLISALFLPWAFFPSSTADVIIVTTHIPAARPNDTSTTKAYVAADRMRVESQVGAENNTLIFRQDKGLFWVINNKERSYMEFTKKDLQQIKNKMNEAMKTMEAQMKNMPPEQRQMVEQMMKGRMTAMPTKASTAYKKTASGEKVNQWVCDKYEGYAEGQKKQDVWTTNWKQLGLSPADFQVMQDMGDFFEGFHKDAVASFLKVGSEAWEKEQGYSGVPVKTISYAQEQPRETTEIKEIQHQKSPASLFELPSGLRKKETPLGQMGRP